MLPIIVSEWRCDLMYGSLLKLMWVALRNGMHGQAQTRNSPWWTRQAYLKRQMERRRG